LVKNRKKIQEMGKISGGWESHRDIAIDPKEKVKNKEESKPIFLLNSSFPRK
jgi:hypothetical protein